MGGGREFIGRAVYKAYASGEGLRPEGRVLHVSRDAGAEVTHLHAGGGEGLDHGLGVPPVDEESALCECGV